jgi:DNA-binding CsgD family transcriptional regulator
MSELWHPLAPRVASVLERVYAIDEPDHYAWLTGIEDAMAPSVPGQLGALSAFYRRRPNGTAEYIVATPRAWAEKALHVSNDVPPGPIIDRLGPAGCYGEHGVFSTLPAFTTLKATMPGFPDAHDAFGINSVCASGLGVSSGFMLPRVGTVPPAQRRQWGRIARHVAAAARLRMIPRMPELVMDPAGKTLHAEGAAVDARAVLRDAARMIDRVRGKRVTDADEALALWHVLTERRWSIADRFEENGRRYVVAYANEPSPPSLPSGLTPREMQVAALAAAGHSNKEIAYELGVSPSTIASHLASAMRRLRVRTRVGLTKRLVARVPTPGA